MMVKLENISVSYGEKKILRSLSLDIPGSAVITGSSGSGKSTVLKVIGGFITPVSGTVSFDFKKAAYMFQEDRLLPWLSVRQNVAAVSSEKKADEMLDKVRLSELTDKKVTDISGGEQRRCALARALAFESDFLLLDEPFKGLDEKLIGEMAGLILAAKKPYIVILHSSYEINILGRNAQRIDLPSRH